MRSSSWLAAVLVLLSAAGSSGAESRGAFVAQPWTGTSVFDATGFVRCQAIATLASDTELGLAVDRGDEWSFYIANRTWTIPEGQSYSLVLQFDRSAGIPIQSKGAAQGRLNVIIGRNEALVGLLRNSLELRVSSGSFDQRYDLQGSADAIDQLRQCREQELWNERQVEVSKNVGTAVPGIIAQLVLETSLLAKLSDPIFALLGEVATSPGQPKLTITVGEVIVEAVPVVGPAAPQRRTADAAREAQMGSPSHDEPSKEAARPSGEEVEPAVPDGEQFGPFWVPSNEPTVIVLFDEITPGSMLEFRSAVAAQPKVTTLVLMSPGGSVNEALLIAHQAADLGLETVIPFDGECYSACAYVFFAGSPRTALGELGVHQVSGEGVDAAAAQWALSAVLEALNTFEVPQAVITLMLRTRPDDMHVFSADEIAKYKLNRGEVRKPAIFGLTVMPQNTSADEKGLGRVERIITVSTFSKLDVVLMKNGFTVGMVDAITPLLADVVPSLALPINTRLRILFGASRTSDVLIPYRLSIYQHDTLSDTDVHLVTVALTDRGNYVRGVEPSPIDFPEEDLVDLPLPPTGENGDGSRPLRPVPPVDLGL